jgi:hypothetical protein
LVTWGWPKPRERQGHGAAIVIAGVTTRLGVWEVHIQGEVPQELVPNDEVDPDGSPDFVQKGQKSSGELTALKGAWLIREGAVGNVPRGNALAAYFTFFVRIALTGLMSPVHFSLGRMAVKSRAKEVAANRALGSLLVVIVRWCGRRATSSNPRMRRATRFRAHVLP